MWRDIGLGEWLFDFDRDADLEAMPAAVLAMARNPAAAKEKAAKGRAFVERRHREGVDVLRRAVSRAGG